MHRRVALGVASLAAATLLLETTLTRLLAVAQFYHFAFLVISLALLGFGASGALLTMFPRLAALDLSRLLAACGTAFAGATGVAYIATNAIPLDSYSIAWDRRQILYFVVYYLALTLPFVCGGLGIAGVLAAHPRGYRMYAANLVGSAAGVVVASLALSLAGVPGALLVTGGVALLPVLLTAKSPRWLRGAATVVTFGLLLAFGSLVFANANGRAVLGLTLSPYKGLVSALRYPGSVTLTGRWNALARVDIVAQAGTRQLPGLSYTYHGEPPEQLGLSVDADSMQPVPLTSPAAFAAGPYMPEAVAFQLRPDARVLVLEPAGGLGVLQALHGGARHVTAVVSNPLIIEAVRDAAGAQNVYSDARVRVKHTALRSFLAQDAERYDIVFLPLTDAYRPVASGAYSLAEAYGLTREGYAALMARCVTGRGFAVVTRWVQTPPSEDLRMLATLYQVLFDQRAPDISRAIVAYRGIQTVTALVKPSGWTDEELATIRQFVQARRYDLVAGPGVGVDEVNRYNRLASPDLYLRFQQLSESAPSDFYAGYPYAVAPSTDDRPFFFHFFRWGQAGEVLATLGRTWQPFGGSGYLVLFALLGLVSVITVLFILAPTLVRRRLPGEKTHDRGRALVYFGLLGLAFMLVEIPFIQRWIVVAGHATYAFTGVVLVLLVGSSAGSLVAPRLRARGKTMLLLLGVLAGLLALVGGSAAEAALRLPVLLQWAALAAILLPAAVLMGVGFPLGLSWMEERARGLIPWAWAVNGCASVIGSVLAAILTLSFGFGAVLALGALCYALAAFVLSGPVVVFNDARSTARS